MKLTNISLACFRRFEHLDLSLVNCSQVVLVGNNGSGKSSILEAVAMGLSWLVARILREKGSGSTPSDDDILNGETETRITLEVEHQDQSFRWSLAKTRKGGKKNQGSKLGAATRLADIFREALSTDEQQASLPLIAYYPVTRVVLDIPLKIKVRHHFNQIDGYDNALRQGVDFRRFFEWFRECEDSENEAKANLFDQSRNGHQDRLENELNRLPSLSGDPQLDAVRNAITSFIPGFANLRIQRRPRLRMMIDKNGQTLDVVQLSDGEKSFLALVGDIARRLAMMNPGLKNPLTGKGIVLIDEVDLHLHPQWQQTIMGNLVKTFPNVQFILTTHSPIVISQERKPCCFVLADGKLKNCDPTFGLDVNQVLMQEMDVEIRAPKIQRKIDRLLETIEQGNEEKAENLLTDLKRLLPVNHIEVTKARLLLRRLQARHRKQTEETS
ncbi:MAG: AAA family ATPase [Magnetococcales bacterium]|nr:AAA family ATPase [Magnetococcales bacterium]